MYVYFFFFFCFFATAFRGTTPTAFRGTLKVLSWRDHDFSFESANFFCILSFQLLVFNVSFPYYVLLVLCLRQLFALWKCFREDIHIKHLMSLLLSFSFFFSSFVIFFCMFFFPHVSSLRQRFVSAHRQRFVTPWKCFRGE